MGDDEYAVRPGEEVGRGGTGPFGGLSPADAGRRAAEKTNRIRREKKEALEALPEEERARARLAAETDRLVQDLLNAAFGRPPFANLTQADRFKALTKALEYGIGRPTTAPKTDKEEAPRLPTAEDLF